MLHHISFHRIGIMDFELFVMVTGDVDVDGFARQALLMGIDGAELG